MKLPGVELRRTCFGCFAFCDFGIAVGFSLHAGLWRACSAARRSLGNLEAVAEEFELDCVRVFADHGRLLRHLFRLVFLLAIGLLFAQLGIPKFNFLLPFVQLYF